MNKNYDCSCYQEYPNVLHKRSNGAWKCIDKYEKVEDWKPTSACRCKTHCRRKRKEDLGYNPYQE